MGHSAGATHVATYVGHPEFHAPKAPRGRDVLLRRTYDLTKVEMKAKAAVLITEPTIPCTRSARRCQA